ncbi:ADP-ribose glycohydrolase MACROD2 [Microcaecilia unicolor]|uniref:ADP-ribose glycohydrolase MACROD2 n=1 Tax=Microcaecilia unicolor TaxID=1415580 RepID=A0A6P7X4J2_9AMPH|nr:ADP-ribose glycohydrolase MACROD2 [Microcaecilia unicolor]
MRESVVHNGQAPLTNSEVCVGAVRWCRARPGGGSCGGGVGLARGVTQLTACVEGVCGCFFPCGWECEWKPSFRLAFFVCFGFLLLLFGGFLLSLQTSFPVSLGNLQAKANNHSNMYPSNRKKKLWREEKERLLNMTLEERRKEYVRDYVPLKDIPSWLEDLKNKSTSDGEETEDISLEHKSLSQKVSLYRGDITLLEIDAIVNAANSSLLGGGGVDGCIHRAAGPCLFAECRTLIGCATGQAKITCGYNLPAKYVIHTVGPIARGHIDETTKEDLASCYKSSLKLAKENNVRSIAFPCISTGIYGFPNEPAADIALSIVKEWLKKNPDEMDRIIFCVFLEVDFKIYKKKISEFFPIDDVNEEILETSETSEGLEQKAQSPPPKKYKGKKTEDLKDTTDDDHGMEEKQTSEEMEGMSQEIVEEKSATISSLTEETESSKDKESSNDSKDTQVEDQIDHLMNDQDQAEGTQHDFLKDEMKTQTDSQCSFMEVEESDSDQGETAKCEKPAILPLKEKGKEIRQAEEITSAEPLNTDHSSNTENDTTNLDAEMNSQVESLIDPTECQPEEQVTDEENDKEAQ